MNIDNFEIWVHDHILKNPKIRHLVYGIYQRLLYAVSPKFKFEGNVFRITPDDGFEYLFGYYDKCPWSDNGRYMLALQVKNASSHADSTVPANIVRIDLENNNSIEVIAVTHSWNVQQGCMAQWIDDTTVLYNDYRNGKYCSVLLNLSTKSERILTMPVYTVSSCHKTALSLDFSRLHRLRPGYGYANIPEKTKKELCPDTPCIWKIDIESGEIMPLLKYTDFAAFEPRPDMRDAEHKVNHLMFNPDASRFMVLHRWFKNGVKYTRLVTCDVDGKNMYNLSDDDFVSHCCWKSNNEVLSYLNKNNGGKGYYLMKDKMRNYKRYWPQLSMDGHPTYSSDGKMVVTDTYPDRRRIQSLYVMSENKIYRIARVFSPFKYSGDVRCDLHPRWNKEGTQLCFDASFEGKRSVYTVNVPSNLHVKRHVKNTISKAEPPIASIIMPCYNAGKFLDETFNGLENQTYQDFEVICINDGSKDDTLFILKSWQKKGTLNIQIIDKENGGVSKARNDGLKAAKGKYVIFLDADDIYHDEYVEQLIRAMEQSDADVAYCRLDRKYENVMCALHENIQYVVLSQKKAMDDLLYRMRDFGFYCYIYRKDILNVNSIEFDCNTKFGEDREFNWKYLCHCKNACFIDAPLYWYRVNNESATQKKASWRKVDLLFAVKRIEKYLQDHHCEFSSEFNSYMYARAMWAVAKTFAVSKDKELFSRLRKEFDVKTCMKKTANDANKLVSLASRCYLVNPRLFYFIVGLKK